MKSILKLFIAGCISLLFFPGRPHAQAPNLGATADFVLYTSAGAVGSTGITSVLGSVGTNSGDITNFNPLFGEIHNNDAVTAQCVIDLLLACTQLNSAVATIFPLPVLGNGQILYPGVYSIPQAASVNDSLGLDAQGAPNAIFIIKVQGALTTSASAKVYLLNGALARNVYWKVDGAISMATGTYMRGTLIANAGAISMGIYDTLEGRALSTAGAISVYGSVIYSPYIVLPVTLIDFTATIANKAVELSWTTAGENSLERYEVQRSGDGRNFHTIGSVAATNEPIEKTYKWMDSNPLIDLSFYRLKMIDMDHLFKYSGLEKIQMNVRKAITVFPNPVTDQIIRLQFNRQLKGRFSMQLYTTYGEKIMGQWVIHDGTDAVRDIPLNKNLPTGLYYLEVCDPAKNKQTITIRIN